MDEYEKQAKEVIEKIDPSLEYCRRLYPSSLMVYQVTRRNSPFVLKIADYREYFSDITGEDKTEWRFLEVVKWIRRERKALRLLKDVSGITHLIKEYKSPDDTHKCPILKEYYDGIALNRFSNERITDSTNQQKMIETIESIHNLGVVSLDIKLENTVVSFDRKDVCIIELGSPIFKTEVDYSEFEKLRAEDLERLERFVFN
jgi:serine/threonine protein kinase